MTSLPTPTHVARLVSSVRKKLPAARSIGVRYEGRWKGPETLDVGDGPARVAWCPSALSAREALSASGRDETLVLLTDRTPADLGADVLARLAKGKLFSVIPWEILQDLFGAGGLDRRLLHERWMADALLEAAPPEGFPPSPTGFLDADTAWGAYLTRGLGFASGAPDARGLVEWASDPVRVARFQSAAPEARAAVGRRLSETIGPLATPVLLAAESAASPADALTIGLVCRVLFHPEARTVPGLRSAAVRLEPILGGTSLSPEVGARWADEAEALLSARWKDLPTGIRYATWKAALDRADALLAALKGQAGAFLSDFLPSSLEQRLRRTAAALSTGLASGRFDLAEMERLRTDVARHLLADRNPERADAVDAACRLARWIDGQAGRQRASTFFGLCREFVDSSSYVDAARERLSIAESVGEVASAYRALLSRLAELREDENRAFGAELARWCSAPGSSASEIPVEDVLLRVVAPIAQGRRVLLVVLDGMSYGVFRALSPDLVGAGWKELASEAVGRRLSALSAVPSVTEVSRASLLCGALVTGGSADEKTGFSRQPDLLAACRAKRPPLLFHKADLAGPGGTGVSPRVLETVEAPENRVVAAVLNAVDDHLLKGDQLHVRWSLATLQPLRALLDAASAASRVVILTADHGHVVERELAARSSSDSGERYRPPTSPPLDDEVVIEGPRVPAAYGGEVVVPWSERVRYGQKKNGYHGGATPQEMVVPLAVWVATEERPAGWELLGPDLPTWWEPGAAAAPAPAPAVPKGAAAPKGAAREQLELPVAVDDWIARLLASTAYADQKSLHGRLQGADEHVRVLLAALESFGGQATKAALARKMDLPAFRLAGLLPAVRRLLNVDGYAVLAVDDASDTVTLNRGLLEAQFDLR